MEVIVKTQKVFPVSWTSKNKPSLFFEIDAFHPVLAVCGEHQWNVIFLFYLFLRCQNQPCESDL